MGSSLVAGWRRAWPMAQVSVVTRAGFRPPEGQWLAFDEAARLSDFVAIVLAVKPADAAEALAGLSQFEGARLLVSVAAGLSLAQLEAACPSGWRCVRAMTSLAIALGAGAAVAAARDLGDEDRRLCERLLPAPGGVVWIEETEMDAATALMGSGPAYFFRLAETLLQAGAALGLEPRMAAHLVRATLAGSGALAAANGQSLVQLKAAVASPGGTTAAALEVLDCNDALARLVARAAEAATRRGAELRSAGPVNIPG
ncbi:MAG: proC [Phenylobacterium sp.]|nr:proC [Phenylobacterium sp.]